MKYIYYILGILILITIGLAVRLSSVRVEVSEPALVINDRVISKVELGELAKMGSYHSQGENFLDSVITRELLIQEAVKEGINKEEAFRKSVEDYYEQSLVKILIDRKYQSFSPVVTEELIAKYKEMYLKKVKYTKLVYKNEEDLHNGKVKSTIHMESDFENLSDTLKYSLFLLTPGSLSRPELSDKEYVVYRLDETFVTSETGPEPDGNQVRSFLINQGKSAMFDSWLGEIRKSADIQILPTKADK